MELIEHNGVQVKTHKGVSPSEECLSRRMGTSPFAPKLTDQRRYEVVRKLAWFETVPTVQQFVREEWGIDLTAQTIHGYLREKKWRPLFDRCRQEWAAGVAEVPIAHKRYRLEKLMELLDEAESNPNLPPEKRVWQILKILDMARLEMEEEKTQFTNVFMTQINEMSDEDLMKRRDELLRRVKQYKLPVRKLKTIDTQPEQGETT